ncbi:hypothetical protein Aduo_005570 [Ancylostoma duodenale]
MSSQRCASWSPEDLEDLTECSDVEIEDVLNGSDQLIEEKREASKTGGGRAVLPRLSAAQMKAYQALETKPRLTGLANAPEIGHRTSVRAAQVCSEDELSPPPPKKAPKTVSRTLEKSEPKNTYVA